jgi:hypothetical protein
MNCFAVLHITKYKELSGIGAHIDRKHTPENADRVKVGFNEEIVQGSAEKLLDVLGNSIDRSKSKLNEQVKGKEDKKLSVCVEERIREGHTVIDKRTGQVAKIRKDAVKALGVILTGSHERMMKIQENEMLFDQWKRDNYDFACRTWGEKNIVRFTLHMDEKTPHFHCVVVPINSEGRLSAFSFCNGREQLKSIQDQYAMAMSKYGLERGIPKILSHREHVKTKDYYQSAQVIIEQAEDLTESIKKSNFLKLDRVRDEMKVHVSQLKLGLMEQLHKVKYLAKTNDSLMENVKKNSFERGFYKDALECIKREIPLIPFATDKLGWSIVKAKSTKKDVVLSHPKHGSIIAPTSPKEGTGHWVYSHTQGGGGTLVDLLRYDRWGWEKINELVKDNSLTHRYQQDYQYAVHKQAEEHVGPRERLSPKKQKEEVEKYLARIITAKGDGFLKNREIDKDTYRDMSGLTVSKQSAVFHLYTDLDKDGGKRMCSTITYYHDRTGNSKKFFQKELPRGVSVLVEHGKELKNAKRIFITESPVDALSYKQLHPNETKDTVFVSTCGSLSMGIKRDIEQVCQMAKEREHKVVLGFDNDVAGRKMTEVVAVGLREEGVKYEVVAPKHGKDWNDELKWVNNPSLQRDEEMDQRMEQVKSELFQETEYEKSLLVKLGIDKETYMDFKEHVDMKFNEQAVLVELKNGKELVDGVEMNVVEGDRGIGIPVGEDERVVALNRVEADNRIELKEVDADRGSELHGVEAVREIELNGLEAGRGIDNDDQKAAREVTLNGVETERVSHMRDVESERGVEVNGLEADRVPELKYLESECGVEVGGGLEPEKIVDLNNREVALGKDVEFERSLEITQEVELHDVESERGLKVSQGLETHGQESDNQLELANSNMMNAPNEIEERNVVENEMRVSRNWILSLRESTLNEYLSETTISNEQEQLFVLNGDMEKTGNIILVASPMDAMMHYQQVVGQAVEAGEDRQEVATKHMIENCYIYCPVEDRVQAKEAVIEVIEQAYEREQTVEWVASKENDPLSRLMEEVEQNVEQSVDQKIERVELQKDWNELENNISEEMIANINMKPDVQEIEMKLDEDRIEKVGIDQAIKSIGRGVDYALDLLSSLADQDEGEDLSGMEEDEDEDEIFRKKKKGKDKDRGMGISM